MRASHGWLRDLLVTLAGALALSACHSPDDAGHRIYGYVDADGREVIAPRYLDALPFHEGLAAVQVAEGWGYIDTTGRWVIRPAYRAAASFSSDRASVCDSSGACGYIDRSGRWVIPARYLVASTFVGDRAFVMLDQEHSQVIDREGRVVAEMPYAAIGLLDALPPFLDVFARGPLGASQERGPSSDDVDALRAEGRIPIGIPGADIGAGSGYADLDGKPVAGTYTSASAYSDGRARVSSGGKYGFIGRDGSFVVPPRYEDALLRFSRGRTIVVHDGQAWLIDTDGNDVASLGEWPWPSLHSDEGFGDLAGFVGYGDFFADGLIPWQRDGKWGYVALDGSWAIPPRYQMAHPFHDGRASVQADGFGLLIDAQGRELARLPPGWWIAPGGGSRLQVGTATQWGFADADGRPPAVLPYAATRIRFAGQSFADARPLRFSEGLAIVSRIAPHRWRVIDASGRELASGRYDLVEDAGDGRYAVAVDQRWALANSKLEILSDASFDKAASFFGPGDAGDAVAVDGRMGCVDRRGRWRSLPVGVNFADCEAMPMLAGTESPARYGVLSSGGRWLVPPAYQLAWRLEGAGSGCFALAVIHSSPASVGRVACIEQDRVRYSEPRQFRCELGQLCFLHEATGWRRLDFGTLRVTGPSYAGIGYDAQGRVAVRSGERWSLLDATGRVTLTDGYDEIVPLDDKPDDWWRFGGAAITWRAAVAVRRDGHWGVLSLDGIEILPLRYGAVERLADDLFAVREGAAWGVVRDRGEVVVPPRFDELLQVSGDLLLAKSGGTVHLQTLGGRPVLDPAPPWLQRTHQLSDFFAGFWAVFTLDRELYFIDRQSRAVHRVDPPAGRVWLEPGYTPRESDEIEDFKAGGFSGELYARPAGESPDMELVPLVAVVVDQHGRLLPWLFDGAELGVGLPANHYRVDLRGKCGVVDDRGGWLVPLAHDHCDVIEGGRVIVGDEDY